MVPNVRKQLIIRDVTQPAKICFCRIWILRIDADADLLHDQSELILSCKFIYKSRIMIKERKITSSNS